MRIAILAALAALGLAGCINVERAPPAQNTTVVVPPGSTVICPASAPSC
jgi:hypothetical protein